MTAPVTSIQSAMPQVRGAGILVCDDQVWSGATLAAALHKRGGWQTWSARTPEEAGQVLATQHPHVCLLEERLLAAWGTSTIRLLLTYHWSTTAVVLATRGDAALDVTAREAGVSALAHRHWDLNTLVQQINQMERTGQPPRATMSRGFPLPVRQGSGASHASSPLASLTRRQHEVLDQLCTGASTETIARSMCISVNTARTHIQRVLVRLGVHSRLEAVALVRQPVADRRAAGRS